jgi:glucosamine--fructose-6-phosphate aminotransferase (isomerizing)
MLGKKFIEHMANLRVDVDIASEFRYGDTLLKKGEAFMVISQSARRRTRSPPSAAQRAWLRDPGRQQRAGSTISREADHVLYTYAGRRLPLPRPRRI